MKPRTPPLWFADFWHDETEAAIKAHNPWYHILARAFDVQLDQHRPEFLLYSSFGHRFWAHEGIRIFCSGKPEAPDFANCDWAFTCDVRSHHGRNMYVPPWAAWDVGGPFSPQTDERDMTRPPLDASAVERKQHFCAFVQRNPRCAVRNEFFHLLHARQFVHAAGPLFNNSPIPTSRTADDHYRALPDFYSQFKFVLAFESVSVRGYLSEKLILPLLGRAVPIYWGDPLATAQFHPDAFLRAADFPSLDALADHVLKLDRDDALYLSHLNAPLFRTEALPACAQWDKLADRFEDMFAHPVPPVARQRWAQKYLWRHLPQRGAVRQLRKRFVRRRQRLYQRRFGTQGFVPARPPDAATKNSADEFDFPIANPFKARGKSQPVAPPNPPAS